MLFTRRVEEHARLEKVYTRGKEIYGTIRKVYTKHTKVVCRNGQVELIRGDIIKYGDCKEVHICSVPSVCSLCPLCMEANKELEYVRYGHNMLKDYFTTRKALKRLGFDFGGKKKEVAVATEELCLKRCDIDSKNLELKIEIGDNTEISCQYIDKNTKEAVTVWKQLPSFVRWTFVNKEMNNC